MGHLHPSSQNFYVLGIMDFLPFIYHNLILAKIERQRYQIAPQTKFLATPLNIVLKELSINDVSFFILFLWPQVY